MLGLRLHQRGVTQRQVGGDLPRLERIGRDHVDRGTVRQLARDRARGGLGRIGIPLRVRVQRALRIEAQLRGLQADEFDAVGGVDRDLVGAAGGNANVHQLRKLIDGAVALIHQVRGGGIVRAQALELVVELGNLLHGRVGLPDRNVEILLHVGAQGLDALRRGVELLRHRLRGLRRRDLRRRTARRRRQRLQRRREIRECVFERAGSAGRPVSRLQLGQHARHLVGIGAARGFRTQLRLHELIERTVDAGDPDARSDVTGRLGNLVDGPGDIARRLRVADIRRYDRERCLIRAQRRHCRGE
jgi:hypothetical protein